MVNKLKNAIPAVVITLLLIKFVPQVKAFINS